MAYQAAKVWLKSHLVLSLDHKRQLVEPNHPDMSVVRQCELLDLARSSLYYKPVAVDAYELHLMHLVNAQSTKTPFYGIRRMTAWLRTQGKTVNHKRVQRLMRQMGTEAIYRCPRTTIPSDNARRYPYLLKGLTIDDPIGSGVQTSPVSGLLAGLIY